MIAAGACGFPDDGPTPRRFAPPPQGGDAGGPAEPAQLRPGSRGNA
ncbi:hypothetical protein AMP9_1115 [plant metagenome]|uniref:Uncharacterized protein n=1 Tax=plant metagenome TaxID=1297885 RepID=A0A484NRU8_9ZZZZ